MEYETGIRLDRLEANMDALIKILMDKGILPIEKEVGKS